MHDHGIATGQLAIIGFIRDVGIDPSARMHNHDLSRSLKERHWQGFDCGDDVRDDSLFNITHELMSWSEKCR
jgi:hypothetical protein